MKSLTIAVFFAGVILAAASGSLLAAGKLDIGKMEYEDNCAACHGFKGKGDGVIAPELKTAVPDLTILAKKNNGIFPTARFPALPGANWAGSWGAAGSTGLRPLRSKFTAVCERH